MEKGWYYLHTNGDLVYKRELGETAADLRESDFVKMFWRFDPLDRECAWNILIESLSLGAKIERVTELAQKWMCNNEDADRYATRVGCALSVDGNQYMATRTDFDNLQESPAGFGDTKLEAMADLCQALGAFRPQKTWGMTFRQLLS